MPKPQQYYVVLADGTVYKAPSKKVALHAADVTGGYETLAHELVELPQAIKVVLYNRARPERPVTSFRDRATAERALDGVLDFLATPLPAHLIPTQTSSKKERAMDAVEQAPERKKRGPKKKELSAEVVQRVADMRVLGMDWNQIMQELHVGISFVHRVRAHLKRTHPSVIRPLGPGSPSYGTYKKAAKKAKTPAAPNVTQEEF